MSIHGDQLLSNPQLSLVQTARVWAVLPAAPLWDAVPVEMVTNGLESVSFYFFYTRGAAGGDVQFRIETSPYSLDALASAAGRVWTRATLFAAGAVASGADSLSNIQRTDVEYGSTAAAVEGFIYGPLELGQTVERMQVICTESGDPQTPGSLEVVAVFSPV